MALLRRAESKMGGELAMRVSPAHPQHHARSVRIPGYGRVLLTRDPGQALITAREVFASHLEAIVRGPDGGFLKALDLGSGVVSAAGVMAMANDPAWAHPSAEQNCTLGQAKWHGCGTGVTAATETDLELQTPAAPTATEAIEAVQSLVSAGKTGSEFKSVSTMNYTGSAAITEWGLFTAQKWTQNSSTLTAGSTATTAVNTGNPWTASSATARGEQLKIIVCSATAKSYGLILSSAVGVLTVPAWYLISNGNAGTTPVAEAYTVKPVCWDHKTFTSIGVENGSSIEFKYALKINAGG